MVENSRKATGISQYESELSSICMVQGISGVKLRKQELESCLGAAMVIAFIRGESATISAFSQHLDIEPRLLMEPFNRLKINGIFSDSYNARSDKALRGEIKGVVDSIKYARGDGSEGEVVITGNDMTKNAWGIIAGIACGATGIKNDID